MYFKIQSHCENITFSEKIIYDRFSQKVTHIGGGLEINYINIFQNAPALSVSAGKRYPEYQFINIF